MSQIRRVGIALAMTATIFLAYGLGRHNSHPYNGNQKGRHVLYYVDPMHPAYKSDKPGIAPDCGMPLEPVYAEDMKIAAVTGVWEQLPAGAVSIDGPTQRLLGIRLATVEKNNTTVSVRAVGRVIPEDTKVFRVNSGVDGFIQKTYEDSAGLRVEKDQKLATYYSPDFLAIASGFLAASERVPGAAGTDGARTVPFPGALSRQGVSSIQGYTDRLKNLGMSDAQIRKMAENRQLPENVDVVSPVDGFILARNISAGQHFDHGMEFYRIADLREVWVVAEVFEQEASLVRPGGAATITLNGEGRQLSARITDSLPQSEAGGGTVKIRLQVQNPGFILRPDMLVDVDIPVRLPAALTVPLDALVDSGERARVYIEKSEGVFEPREVETGWRDGETVEIRKGVQPGERVVVAATFLVDSESRLKSPNPIPLTASTAAKPFRESAHAASAGTVIDPSCGMPVDAAQATQSGNTFAYRGVTYYFCSAQCKQKFQHNSTNLARGHQGDD